ncbi:transposable element Tcb2 transposase [Trichonephila clavipes]|nr:transposable element Tcb2 transposase [Trichonephila clavipes]
METLHKDSGFIERKPGQGRPRAMRRSPLSIITRHNRGTTTSQLSCYLYADTGTCVSRGTVSKNLHGRWLFIRRPAVCVSLMSMNRRVRVAWCRQHRD